MKGTSMPTATVTSKGQITVPIEIRKALRLIPGAKIDFYEIEDGDYAMRAKTGSIMDMRGCLAYDGPTITIEEMNRAVHEHAARLDRASKSDASECRTDGEAA
jgi:antitoxin PrlF